MVTTPKKASFYLKIIGVIDFLQEQINKLDFLEGLASSTTSLRSIEVQTVYF